MALKRVACVGAGLVGAGWASVFSAGGMDVSIFDANEGIAEKSLEQVRRNSEFITSNGLSPAKKSGRVTVASSLKEAVEGCEYVQESVFESYRAKKSVFKEISRHNQKAVIGSSTSSLSISKIQEVAADPRLCVSVHPLNPVYIIPAVEVAGGKKTSPSTVSRACNLMTKVGKVPVRLNFEVHGHVADRLQAALWREALDLLERGVADAGEIDKAMTYGLGLRWAIVGPFLRAHLGGGEGGLRYYLEHIEPSHAHIWNDMRTWKRVPAGTEKKALASVGSLTQGSSYRELVAWRDGLLVKLLRDKSKARGPDT